MNAPNVLERRTALVDVAPGYGSIAAFEALQREAKSFCLSSMVPNTFRDYVRDKESGEWVENPQALSNAMIALNMAVRMRADPLMVMQNLYIVNGVPSWSTKFLIGLFNLCGRFTAIRYALNEAKDFCFAYCTEIATGERIEGPSVSIAMAKAEGWYARNPKWRSMPEVMLRNRGAAFLIRLTAPELSLGLLTQDEVQDVVDVEAREVAAPPPPKTPTQTVRDILARERAQARPEDQGDVMPPVEAMPEPAPAAPMPEDDPPEPNPAELAAMAHEPADLPVKDGELPLDAPVVEPLPPAPAPPGRAPGLASARRSVKLGAPSSPGRQPFNVEAYARRINACADVDLLTVMRDEIAALGASYERDDLMSVVDARVRELLPKGEGDTP